MHTPESLMTHVAALHRHGVLGIHELMAMSLIVGRWMADWPVSLAELDGYLPVSDRQRRRILQHLRDQKLISTAPSAHRNVLVLPMCAAPPVTQKEVPPPPQPPPVKEEPPVPVGEPQREVYVPVTVPQLWCDVLSTGTHSVKRSAATAVQKLLKKHTPNDLKPAILSKVSQAKYPLAYLATLCEPDGTLKQHVAQQPPKPTSQPQPQQTIKATTAPAPAPKPEPPKSDAPEDTCQNTTPEQMAAAFARVHAILAATPTPPYHRR